MAGRDDRTRAARLTDERPPTIEQVIAAIPDWAGRAVTAERIPAGLTNTNYRVEVDGTPYFVRIPGAATDLLAVDRANELHNTRAAAETGVAPRVLHHAAGLGRVRPRVARRPDDVERGARRAGHARADRRVAAPAPRRAALPRRLRHVPAVRALPRLVDEREIAIPAGYREQLDLLPRIEAALGRPSAADRPVPQRPAGRELPRRRRAAVDRRLRVQRQQRPGVRARQHVPRSSASTTAQVARAVRRLLRRGDRLRCSPGCGSR